MVLTSKVKSLVIDRGYNSLADFAEKENVSYHILRRLAYNKTRSIDVNFLVDVCKKLGCEVGDLLVLKNESEASADIKN